MLVLVLPLLVGTVPARPAVADDFHVWFDGYVFWDVAQGWQLRGTQRFRFDRTASRLWFISTTFGVLYGELGWLQFCLSYEQIFFRVEEDWQPQERFEPDIIFVLSLPWIVASNRTRFEFRIREDVDDIWVFRNLSLVQAKPLTRWVLTPFISDEVLIVIDTGRFVENRFIVGMNGHIYWHLFGGLYYMWWHRVVDDPLFIRPTGVNDHILGVTLALPF